MSEADQVRLNEAKKSLLAAGKQAQKDKDAAKAAYESEKDMGLVPESQSVAAWAATNYPTLQMSYEGYKARQAQYSQALQQYDESASQEWQKGQQEAFAPVARGDPFESYYFIYLPDE